MRLITFLAVVLSLAIPAAADFAGGNFSFNAGDGVVSLYAPTRVSLHTVPGGSSGGPFKAYNRGGGDGTVPFYPGVGAGEFLFKTFCLESTVTFNPGTYYWVSVNPKAHSGNVGAVGDPISDVTEWIYDRWKSGNPDAWTPTQVRNSIWYAEEESGGSKTAPWTAALNALSYASTAEPANLGGATHTYALNLWKNFTEINGVWYAQDVQSQLITVPAPGAVLLGMSGFGLIGAIRRRFA